MGRGCRQISRWHAGDHRRPIRQGIRTLHRRPSGGSRELARVNGLHYSGIGGPGVRGYCDPSHPEWDSVTSLLERSGSVDILICESTQTLRTDNCTSWVIISPTNEPAFWHQTWAL